jgi:hypothetical protein
MSRELSRMEHNRYLDLLRVAAIGGALYGHWLLINVTYSSGVGPCL